MALTTGGSSGRRRKPVSPARMLLKEASRRLGERQRAAPRRAAPETTKPRISPAQVIENRRRRILEERRADPVIQQRKFEKEQRQKGALVSSEILPAARSQAGDRPEDIARAKENIRELARRNRNLRG